MEKEDFYYNLSQNPLAPFLPEGKLLGKDSMVFAQSNKVLQALPFENVSSGTQHLFFYLAAHAADEITKAIEKGTFDFSDTQVKMFNTNLKEYNTFCYSIGKKHYTMEELDAMCGEVRELPLDFMGDDEKISGHTTPVPSITLDKRTGECTYIITNEFLRLWVPGLFTEDDEKKERHYLSLIESFKFNGYQDRLYRLINGHMQAISSEYDISISLLKRRMGVKESERAWENRRFIERILKPSCEAINKNSDIRFLFYEKKQEKSARIKSIVFYDFKRIGKESSPAALPYIEGIYKEVLPSNPDHEKSGVIKLNEKERQLATFIHLSASVGISIDEVCELYELYRGDIKKFKTMLGLYEKMLQAGLIKEENRSAFFRSTEIA